MVGIVRLLALSHSYVVGVQFLSYLYLPFRAHSQLLGLRELVVRGLLPNNGRALEMVPAAFQ